MTDRDQYTKLCDQKSFIRILNWSIVQGSRIGPRLFVIFIFDLAPSAKSNHLTKYADDASLLVPEKTDVQINDEFQNVLKWASQNKLTVNMAKTKEIPIVFHKPNPWNYVPPNPISGIEQVLFVKCLMSFCSDLGTHKHIEYISHICNQRYILIIWFYLYPR